MSGLVVRSGCPSQMYEAQHLYNSFRKLLKQKVHTGCDAKQVAKLKCTKHIIFGALFEVRMSVCVAGAKDSEPGQDESNLQVLPQLRKTCSADVFRGQGAAILVVASWSIISPGLLR